MEWQPIETAPKDAAVLLLCNGTVFTAGYESDGWYWGVAINGLLKVSLRLNPTHWMPLPDAPK